MLAFVTTTGADKKMNSKKGKSLRQTHVLPPLARITNLRSGMHCCYIIHSTALNTSRHNQMSMVYTSRPHSLCSTASKCLDHLIQSFSLTPPQDLRSGSKLGSKKMNMIPRDSRVLKQFDVVVHGISISEIFHASWT